MTTNTRMDKTDPRKSVERAWQIAINPRDYSKSERQMLIQRGINAYQSSGDIDQAALLKDLDEFIIQALKHRTKDEIVANPPDIIEYPGRLAVFMSLGEAVMKRHPVIVNDPRRPKVQELIHEYYMQNIYAAAKHTKHKKLIRITIAELVYGRDQEDDYGPPPGRPVEDIVELEDLRGVYFKIPLVHATRKCEGRRDDRVEGAMRSLIRGKYVYVPVDDVHEKYEEYFNGRHNIPKSLVTVIEGTISDDQLKVYTDNLIRADEEIEKLSEMNQDDVLFKSSRYPPKLKVILESIDSVDNETAKISEELTADDVLSALREYAEMTDKDWVKKQIDDMNSKKSIGQQLTKFGNDEDTPHVETISTPDGYPNKYELEYQAGHYKRINVSSIEDLLEFPCMQNLHESLMHSKPVRWELFTFVRYLLEVKELNVEVQDVKDWFSQYDWYKEKVTEYQVEYEKRSKKNGETPLPISCNNDNRNWEKHCIGLENCDYSLYRSVELSDDVYDRLE